jgi:hypothetical protein
MDTRALLCILVATTNDDQLNNNVYYIGRWMSTAFSD